MAGIDLPKSPNVFHPEKPSAVGSRNSLAQEFRDQQAEIDLLLSEEVDKVMNHIASKLPKEVAERLDIMGGIKEKLYNYFNQNYQNMFNRYIVTSEDEMVKKVRNFIDKEEMKTLARYTPEGDRPAARPGRRHGQVQHGRDREVDRQHVRPPAGPHPARRERPGEPDQLPAAPEDRRGRVHPRRERVLHRQVLLQGQPLQAQDRHGREAVGEHPGLRAHQPDLPLPGHRRVPDQGHHLQEHHGHDRQGDREAEGHDRRRGPRGDGRRRDPLREDEEGREVHLRRQGRRRAPSATPSSPRASWTRSRACAPRSIPRSTIR